MTRVSVPFTEGHYYGGEERPNTELADNSPSIYLCLNMTVARQSLKNIIGYGIKIRY
jgi:hypothetical protein